MDKYYKYLILFLCILSSCVVEEDVDLSGNYQRKPVVFSVISPQNDKIKVYVSRTLRFGEEAVDSNLIIRGSSVIIRSNEKSVSVPFDTLSGAYLINASDFPIKKGEKYFLEVTLPTGEKATSETIVPSADIIIDSITDKRSGPFIEYEFDNAFIYRFEHKIFTRIVNSDENELNYACIYKSNIMTVKNEDFFFNISNTVLGINMNFENDTIIHNLIVLDKSLKEYLDYSNSVSRYLNPGNEYDVYKGVYPEYTNIQGGYGIFGSYIKSEAFKLYYLVD